MYKKRSEGNLQVY
jgi:hypothetical protein